MNSIIKNQAGAVRELLDSTSNIGIITGENQNIDSVGASLALFLILQADAKNVQIVSKKEPAVEVSNLFGVNKISKSFQGSINTLTISVPYREGDIEKVSYNIEGDRLNVNLFAGSTGIKFNENEVEYLKKGVAPELIVTIGVGSEQELTSFVDPAQVKTIHIDRNPANALTGDVMLINPSFSSISEIVAEMVRELSFMPDADASQNLMDGISYATRNFTHPATSAFAFEAAGFLLQNGARRKEKPFDQAQDKRFDRTFDRGSDRNQRHNDRRDDRNRNFPRVDQFIDARPPMVQQTQNNSQSRVQVPMQNLQPNTQGNQIPRPFPNPRQTPREMLDHDMPDEVLDSPFVEGGMPEDVPDDWFLPKVFKGSKKGN